MNELNQIRKDLVSIIGPKNAETISEGHIDDVKELVKSASTVDEFIKALGKGAIAQAVKLQIGMSLVLAKRGRGGVGSLAEDILDQQVRKIQRFRNKAYPLSNKQVGVIAKEIAWYIESKSI